MSDATPASNALPPLWRISSAADVTSGCPVETPALGPATSGRSAAGGAAPRIGGSTSGTRCCPETPTVSAITAEPTIQWRTVILIMSVSFGLRA